MNVDDQVIAITGGAHGIGRALAERFASRGAKVIAIIDLDHQAAQEVAERIGGVAYQVDVSDEVAFVGALTDFSTQFGPIDLMCSNAGVGVVGGPEALNQDWARAWEVNVMAHVYAARAVLPSMIERGGGHLLQTISAAGLLTSLAAAPYAVTKHAAVAFAEWLAITYRAQGLKVSALCPQGVSTKMLEDAGPAAAMLRPEAITVEAVADAVMAGLESERFLILPHPKVAHYVAHKAAAIDAWIDAMVMLQAKANLNPTWPSAAPSSTPEGSTP